MRTKTNEKVETGKEEEKNQLPIIYHEREIMESLENNFRVFPNPSDQDAVVYFSTESNATIAVKVFDLLGKEVYNNNMGTLAAGNHNLILNKETLSGSGLYFVRLSVNDTQLTKKFILK